MTSRLQGAALLVGPQVQAAAAICLVIVLVIFVAVTFKAPLPRPLPAYLGTTFQARAPAFVLPN